MLLTVYTTSSAGPANQAETSGFICRLLPHSLNHAQMKIPERFSILPATVEAHLADA